MTTYVLLKFDDAIIDTRDELNNGTLLLHNDPVITPLSDVVKVYPNTSQIIQIQVCVDKLQYISSFNSYFWKIAIITVYIRTVCLVLSLVILNRKMIFRKISKYVLLREVIK